MSLEPTSRHALDVMGKGVTIRAYEMAEITTDPELLGGANKFLNYEPSADTFNPLIAKRFPPDKIVEAHRYLESNQQISQIVVTV